MITASCPECDNDIFFEETPEIGQVLICVNCQAVLEVTWLFPISLDFQEKYPKVSTVQDDQLN
jgi:lysine biosynthesis protein LysW